MAIKTLRELREITSEELMQMDIRELKKTASFARRSVNTRLKKFSEKGMDYALAELGMRPQQSLSPIPRNAEQGQLFRIITEAKSLTDSPMWQLKEISKAEEAWNRIQAKEEELNFYRLADKLNMDLQPLAAQMEGMSETDKEALYRQNDVLRVDKSLLLQLANETSWMERLRKLGYASGEIYEAITTHATFEGAYMSLAETDIQLGIDRRVQAEIARMTR